MFSSNGSLSGLGPAIPQKKSFLKTLPLPPSCLPNKSVLSTRKLTRDIHISFATPPNPLPSLPPTFPLTVQLDGKHYPTIAALSLIPYSSLTATYNTVLLNPGVDHYLARGAKTAYFQGIHAIITSDATSNYALVVSSVGTIVATGLLQPSDAADGTNCEVIEAVGDKLWSECMKHSTLVVAVELEGPAEEDEEDGEDGEEEVDEENDGDGPVPDPAMSLDELAITPPPPPTISPSDLFISAFLLSVFIASPKPPSPSPWNGLYAATLLALPHFPAQSPPATIKGTAFKTPKGLLTAMEEMGYVTVEEEREGVFNVSEGETAHTTHTTHTTRTREGKAICIGRVVTAVVVDTVNTVETVIRQVEKACYLPVVV